MRGVIDQHGNCLTRRIIKAQQSKIAVNRFWFQLRVAIAIEAVQLENSARQFGRNQLSIRFANRGHDAVFELLVVAQRPVKSAFAFAFFVR